jgi:hypothetical protein
VVSGPVFVRTEGSKATAIKAFSHVRWHFSWSTSGGVYPRNSILLLSLRREGKLPTESS